MHWHQEQQRGPSYSISTNKKHYMHMTRICEKAEPDIPKYVVDAYNGGSRSKSELLKKWIVNDKDLEAISFEVAKDPIVMCVYVLLSLVVHALVSLQ